MGEKIVVGPINRGLRNDRTAFVIDNDSFPTLINAYQWRGRVKRKRGTSKLGRLTRYFDSTNPSYTSISLSLSSGVANLLSGYSLETNSTLVPGSIVVVDTVTARTYTDPASDGILVGNPAGSGTVNYTSGRITITGGLGHAINAQFLYYPDLPVLGLEDLAIPSSQFPGTLAFDNVYSYNINTNSPYSIYNVSYYKNPSTATYANYVHKTNITPTTWNGKDYQQFWTVNYQGALWATNGANVPFSVTNIGMQFYGPTTTLPLSAAVQVTANTVDFTVVGNSLVVGDFVFANEFVGGSGLNFQTGYVISSGNTFRVKFPNATIAAGAYTPGILQLLTNRSDTTKDCIRWYDGDPTNASATTPILNGNNGWVNFFPPLSQLSYSIADLPAAQYYLCGAKMIVPFKDRLLFVGPIVQTSSDGSQVYLKDTVIYSQNGTPYYTASYTNSPSAIVDNPASPTNIFNPILVPVNQTATSPAYFEDQTGFGGFISAGVDMAITTAFPNEDVIIMGFERIQARFVYTGNDIVPFNFFVINSELGSGSTFSGVIMDKGIISKGSRGYVITSQVETRRIDLEIPDQVFEVNLSNNGTERVCGQRDFISEWIYFTYPSNSETYKFPNQTLLYNYRDDSWAIFNETYTTYGHFRRSSGFTWATVGQTYATWSQWNEPWNSGNSTLFDVEVIAGNQQGFIVFRDEGTSEATSLYIENISFPTTITLIVTGATTQIATINQFIVGQQVTISGVVGTTELNGNTYTILTATPTAIVINAITANPYISGGTVTPVDPIYSPNHTLSEGDYITISGAIGTISSQVNGNIFSVANPTDTGFSLNPTITSGTYLGGGLIQRMYVPYIQTKQFPTAWSLGRKTRLGPQQYLFSTTSNSQITLLIFLSQNNEFAYNDSPVIPGLNVINGTLVYSTVLYTCPESTNLGLTAPNINLNLVTAIDQQQTWHRMNTSLIGDTMQIGFTLSDTQMRAVDDNGSPISQFSEIEFHGMILDISPSQILC